MKFRTSGAIALFLSVVATSCAKEAPQLYFGQSPPGDTPTVFAPGILSKEGRFEQFLLYSPDGRELTFGVTNSDWSAFSLHHMKMVDGRWTEPTAAPFLGRVTSGLTSCMSFDMSTAYFTSAHPSYPPANIWMSKVTDGGWSEPVELGPPISSDADEFEVAVSENGSLYFSSSRLGGFGDLDIYRARRVDGGYPEVENLGPAINTAAGDDLPYIAADESYLIFGSDRPGGLGQRDLYISYQVDGAWTEAIHLGPQINSEAFDIYPSVSPDGKYLFFSRRKSWVTDEDSDLFWVSARFIDKLRKGVDS